MHNGATRAPPPQASRPPLGHTYNGCKWTAIYKGFKIGSARIGGAQGGGAPLLFLFYLNGGSVLMFEIIFIKMWVNYNITLCFAHIVSSSQIIDPDLGEILFKRIPNIFRILFLVDLDFNSKNIKKYSEYCTQNTCKKCSKYHIEYFQKKVFRI